MAKKQKTTVVFDGDGDNARPIGVKIEYPTLRKSHQILLSELSEDVIAYAACHGLKQRGGDAESGGTPREKYEMCGRIFDALREGNWDLPTREVDTSAIVIEAMARVKGIKQAEVQEAYEACADDEAKAKKLADWRSNAKVKAAIADIRAERAKAAAEEADDDEPTL